MSSSQYLVCLHPGNPSPKCDRNTWLKHITQKAWLVPKTPLFKDAVMQCLQQYWCVKMVARQKSSIHARDSPVSSIQYPCLWGAVSSDVWGIPATFSSSDSKLQRSWGSPSKSADLAGEEVQSVRNQIKKVLTKVTLLSVRTGYNPSLSPSGNMRA